MYNDVPCGLAKQKMLFLMTEKLFNQWNKGGKSAMTNTSLVIVYNSQVYMWNSVAFVQQNVDYYPSIIHCSLCNQLSFIPIRIYLYLSSMSILVL